MSSGKDILIVNPWIYDFTAYDFWLKPLGLLYIAAVLKECNCFRLSFIDCLDRCHPLLPMRPKAKSDGRGAFFKEEVPKPSILKDVPRKYSRYGIPVPLFQEELERVPVPELVLLGCTMTYWYPGVQLAIELIRKKFGNVPVILGGVYATLVTDHARRFSGADIVAQGPGEKIILHLIKDILGDGSCIPQRVEGLDDIPQPAFELLRNKDTLPLLTSRGCPFTCSFCASSLLFPTFEQRCPDSVVQEIESYHHLFHTRNFAFYDDSLLLGKESHIIPILENLIEKSLPLAFHTPNGLHIKEIDIELAILFKRNNFQSLFLSQESFEGIILHKTASKVSEGDLEKALASLEQAGYSRHQVNVYLMVGLPEQDASGVKESILRVQSLGAKPRLAYFSPVPGTGEWEKMVEKGCIEKNADPLLHNKLTFPYIWGNLSPEDFQEIKNMISLPLKKYREHFRFRDS
jgi:radical SAM superfamily enzyme YgiQ (UPF0313 family)